MDINVKNAYDTLAKTCKGMKYSDTPLKQLAEDIYSFICYISKRGADQRYNYFNEVYQNGAYPLSDIEHDTDENVPRTFVELNKTVFSYVNGSPLTTGVFYVGLISKLVQYYMHSRVDRKEIDSEKCIEYLDRLQNQLPKKETVSTSSGHETKVVQEKAEVKEADKIEPEETLDELLEKLNSLIGLTGVKNEVTTLINLIKMNKKRDSLGMKTVNVSKHLVFTGNPGTGKTTVARLLSKIYKQLGVLEKGQLVEVDRGGLVAGYVGQTALKTQEKIDEAKGGILFIDEAYTLAKGGTDFGQEAIDTILKAMEDNRENFVVIVAGYPELMKQFLESNPGLKSRFNKYITFEDYSEEELFEIFNAFSQPYGFKLSSEAEQALKGYLHWVVQHKPENFANGREIRNIFETSVRNQANRFANIADVTEAQLSEIIQQDLPDWVINF
ncbi:MAG: AAA family ATPase [Faecalicoccus sp.]|nr:AAA family ATPase [Faecalicoccus sp.]